ncbi:hypothetical protein [Nocardia sp. NBC_01009]|uniref:hypothetical protein n=1 Tax=Nocardia sp. NBC_01009 TaxID=2975996 RepID=UPI00386BAC2E|nr:zinc ribbon domain-containing protein [Nocardia sp. NBC_01009]
MLIWGWRRTVQQLAMLTLVCGNCHNPAAHALRKLVTKFTLFFIPLFALKTKHTVQCTWCGAESEVPHQRVPELLHQAQTAGAGHGAWQPPAPAPPDQHYPR